MKIYKLCLTAFIAIAYCCNEMPKSTESNANVTTIQNQDKMSKGTLPPFISRDLYKENEYQIRKRVIRPDMRYTIFFSGNIDWRNVRDVKLEIKVFNEENEILKVYDVSKLAKYDSIESSIYDGYTKTEYSGKVADLIIPDHGVYNFNLKLIIGENNEALKAKVILLD